MIVRVPPSFDAPHRYRHDHYTRFVVRNATLTSDMTYDHIRTAFDRSATLVARAQQFRIERNAAVDSGRAWPTLAPGPIAIVHLIPLAAMLGRQSVDVGSLHDGNYRAYAQQEPSWGNLTTRKLNLDGLLVYPTEGTGLANHAFSEIFRSGCLESVRNVRHAMEGPEIIPSSTLARFVRSMTQSLTANAIVNGFPGPAQLAVSLLRVNNVRLGLGARYSQPLAAIADRRDLLIPETWIPSLDALTDTDSVVRPTLDIIWQCFGEPRCLEYDGQGQWAPQERPPVPT